MPRRARVAPGGVIYHVLNRANGRNILFDSASAYRDFLRLVSECARTDRMRILAYCVMPNHWHLLAWPHEDGDLSSFVQRLSIRHAIRWHARNGTAGRGHVYQARFKSFAVQDDEHLFVVHRYIEQNPVRARLVRSPGDWLWSSARARMFAATGRLADSLPIEAPPVAFPDTWTDASDVELSATEMERLRESLATNAPFGDRGWAAEVASRIGWSPEKSPRGRPRQVERAASATLPTLPRRRKKVIGE
jgi:putative transposase